MKYLNFYKKIIQKRLPSSAPKIEDKKNIRRKKNHSFSPQENYSDLEFTYPTILPSISNIFIKLRAIIRIVVILTWTALCIPVQTILLKLPGKMKIKFICVYWYSVARLLGLYPRIFGTITGPLSKSKLHSSHSDGSKRPVLYIANHSSWLDIPVMGGIAPGAFVAKEEVGSWPLISILCKLGRVLFVSRQRQSTAKEQTAMQDRLKEGGSLILFPEGTSSDGSHLYPFMSSFFVLAKPLGKHAIDYEIPIIQPISIVYDRLDTLPVNRLRRPHYSWYGDMELAPHLWSLCQWAKMRASIVIHEPLYPEDYKSRKELAQQTWAVIDKGTSELRRNPSDDQIAEII